MDGFQGWQYLMGKEWSGFATRVLSTILEPDLEAGQSKKPGCFCLCDPTYLDFLLAQSDAIHDVHATCLVRLGIPLILFFEDCLVLRASRRLECRR